MKFVPYKDEFGNTHYFDATRVMFTMSQPVGFDPETHTADKYLTKVALNENMGFILADEEPASVIGRIKAANGIED
jgi:hypothetical protein